VNKISDSDIVIYISNCDIVNSFNCDIDTTVLLTFEHQSSNIMSYEVKGKQSSERTELKS
jgi:hypothetical protein